MAARHVVFPEGPEGTCVAEGWVEVDDRLIVATGRGRPPEDDVPCDDFGNALLSPALVDAHTHLALVALRGLAGRPEARGSLVEDLFYAVEAHLEPGDVRAFARMGAYDALLGGTGLVWDHYYAGDEVAEACREVGLTAVVAPTLQDLGGPGRAHADRALATTEAIAGRADLRAAGIVAALGPHATDTVSDALWEQAVTLAERLALPVHAHLAQSAEEHQRSLDAHGLSPVRRLEARGWLERAPHVFAHGLYVRRDELRALRSATLVVCPYSQLVFAFPARVDVWSHEGVSWVVGTDCAASNDSMSLRKELRFLAGVGPLRTSYGAVYARFLAGDADAAEVDDAHRKPAGPASLIGRVARAGALHPAFRAGVLAPGALASLAVWDALHPRLWPLGDPLRALTHGDVDGALRALFVAGREIGERGDVAGGIQRSDAYRAHREEADRRLRALLRRAGM